MSSLNRVIILGRLGKDPEIRQTQSGQSVATMSLATDESYKDKNGEKVERTEWHRAVAWGRTADLCAQYLAKGSQVLVEGKLQTREWEDQQGQKRYMTEIVADRVQFIGRKPDQSQNDQGSRNEFREPPQERQPAQQTRTRQTQPALDDDIPF